MKHKYILMCALAMIGIATQAQDDVLYDISTTPATEVVVGHIYVLQNRAYPDYGLIYDSNQGFATTFEPVSEQLGQSVTSDQPFLFTATADGITLPVTLININDNGEMGYGNAGGGQVLSPRRNAAASDETTYFTVKDQDGQLAMLTYNVEDEYCDLYGVIYGGENTTPAECAQWIAYEVTEHEHQWEYSDSNVHFCTCGKYAVHELDGCSCTVCQSEVHEFDYENYPLTCTRCGESCHHPRIDHIEAKEPNCYSDGWKEHYECRVCGDVFKDEAGNEPYPYDDCCSYATGHDIDADLHCTRCDAQLIVEGELTNGESVDITMTMTDYDQFSNPAASPLYSFETETSNMLFNVSVSADVTDGRVSVFDKDFQFVDTRWLTDPYMDLEEASTYYAMFYYHGGEEEDTTMDCVATLSLEGGDCIHEWVEYDEDGHSHYHHCTKCDAEDRHYVTGENGVCVCGYKCTEHLYYVDGLASVKATENADGQYIVVKICEYCQHEKTETVDPDGECPEGDNHSWVDDGTINATCTAKGYTYHICKKCAMLYVADFTDINPDNHDWLVEEQWNEEGELVSMHFCCNGCELYGQDQEHNMVDGQCTVCGYWPGHTEHKWETDEYGHYCSIPGCEDYHDWQEHEIDEHCTCTVCRNEYHTWNNGVCEICQVTCSHDHKYLVKGYAADCISDGWKEHYECEYCDAWLNDAGQPMTDEEFDLYIIPATGHLVNNEGICSVCENQITVADEFKWGESKSFEFYPASDMAFQDPMSYPLYQLIIKEGMVTQIDLPEDVDSFVEPTEESDGFERRWMLYPCASEEGGTRVGVGTDMLFNEPYNLTPGTYYMAPIMMSGWNEEVANVELTFPAVIAPCVDEEGNVTSVELTATTEGYAAAADATVEIADGVSFTTPVDFTATGSQVTIDREFTQNTPATINLPFDVDASVMGEKYYTFGGIALNAVTGKWEATMNEATGTLLANTPYIVLPESTTLGISNTATVTFRADASANSSTTSGDWKMVSSVAKKVWSDDENADEIGKTYGFAGKSLTNADGVAIEAGQFVKVVAGAWIPAGRAYLTYKDGSDPTAASHAPALTGDAALPASISVRFVNADGTNGIGTLNTESGHMTIDAWYDLQGRRISEPKQGGIYIRNNKKITVK